MQGVLVVKDAWKEKGAGKCGSDNFRGHGHEGI